MSKAVEAKSESAVAHSTLAIALKLDKSNESTASNRLNSSLQTDDSNLSMLTQHAMLKFLEVKDSEALMLLSKALCIDERFVPALIILAEVLRLTGQD